MNTEKNNDDPDVRCSECKNGFDIYSEEGNYEDGVSFVVECPHCNINQGFTVDLTIKFK